MSTMSLPGSPTSTNSAAEQQLQFQKAPSSMSLADFFSKVVAFRKKPMGCDMTVKTVMWSLRLRHLYTPDSDEQQKRYLEQLIATLLDGRMLYNHWKYIASIDSFASALRSLFAAKKSATGIVVAVRILDVLCFLFRSLEQITGDLNYWQKNVRRDWSRKRLALHWRFFKSLGLACYTLVLLHRLAKLRHDMASMTPKHTSVSTKQRAQLVQIVLFILRNVCDMFVYFQWIQWYNPPKTFQCVCGICSGLLGMRLVWDDLES